MKSRSPFIRSIQIGLVLLAGLAIVAGAWWLGAGSGSGSVHAALERERALEPGSSLAAEAQAAAGEPARADPLGRELLSQDPSTLPSAQPDEVLEPRPRLVGRVVRADGSPAAGARVWASVSRSWLDLPLEAEEDGASLTGARVWTTAADEDGRFGFEAPDSGPVRIAARARGHAPLRRDGWLLRADDERLDLGSLRLEAGVRVAGRVVDHSGAPLAGVRVVDVGSARGAGASLRIARGPEVARSDEQGRFEADELMPGRWHLLFEAEGYQVAAERGTLGRGASAEELLVRLARGEAIEGFVRGVAPGELERWCVEARLSRGEAQAEEGEGVDPWAIEGDSARQRVRRASLGAEGAFRLEGLERSESYRLQLARRGAGQVWRRERSPAPVVLAGSSGVELVLEPRAALVFEVVNAKDGAPLEEFLVHAGQGARLVTDEDGGPRRFHPEGRVLLEDLPLQRGGPPGALRILAPGHKPFERKGLELAGGRTLDLGQLRLEPATELVVRVLAAEDERPLAQAVVVLVSEPDEGLVELARRGDERRLARHRELRFARTDARGEARLAGFGAPSAHLIVALRGRLAHGPQVVPISEGAEAQVVRLGRGGSVLVRVLDPAGRPVRGVRLEQRAPGVPRFDPERDEEFLWGGGLEERTDERGELRFEGLVPGLHAFRADDRQQGTMIVMNEEGVDGTSGAPWREVPVADGVQALLELEVPARGALAGRVTQGGRPLAEADLRLAPRRAPSEGESYVYFPGGSSPLATLTDHDGRYALESVPEGHYDLTVSHAERAVPGLLEVVVSAGSNTFDVLLPDVALEGRVRDPSGRPLEGIELRVEVVDSPFERGLASRTTVVEDERGGLATEWSWNGSHTARSARDGSWRLAGLIDGHPLVVHASGEHVLPAASEHLVLAPGEERGGIDLVLEPAGALEVVLEGRDGSPTPAAQEWLQVLARPAGAAGSPAGGAKGEGDGEDEAEEAPRESHFAMLSSWNRRVVLSGLQPGPWVVELRGMGPARGAALETRAVEIVGGRSERVVFRR